MLREQQIAGKRFQYMLPGPHRCRKTQIHRLIGCKRPQAIRDQAIGGPITSSDHIACAGRRHVSGMSILPLEETRAKARCHDLRRRLAGTVRIMAAQRVDLPIGILPFAIFIHLVGSDEHDGADRVHRPCCLQHARGAHYVGGQRAERITIALPHQGLRCEVEYDFRLRRDERRLESCQIGQIGARIRSEQGLDAGGLEQTGRRGRVERKAMDAGREMMEPKREPAALESGVARDEDAASSPEVGD